MVSIWLDGRPHGMRHGDFTGSPTRWTFGA
jgi:hypothetical protein